MYRNVCLRKEQVWNQSKQLMFVTRTQRCPKVNVIISTRYFNQLEGVFNLPTHQVTGGTKKQSSPIAGDALKRNEYRLTETANRYNYPSECPT